MSAREDPRKQGAFFFAVQQAHLVAEARRLTAGGTAAVKEARMVQASFFASISVAEGGMAPARHDA